MKLPILPSNQSTKNAANDSISPQAAYYVTIGQASNNKFIILLSVVHNTEGNIIYDVCNIFL